MCEFGKDSIKNKGFMKPEYWHFYSCGLSTATIEYSCPSVCLSVCVCFLSVCVCVRVCVCVCVYTITQKIMVQLTGNFNLTHVVYKNSSNEFDVGHCPIKVKVTA